jgi:predicted phosphodiesterase
MIRIQAALGRFALSSIAGLAAAALGLAGSAEAKTLAAWVQLIGPGGEASIRAITDAAQCPDLSVDGKATQMRVRAEPGPLFADADSLPSADFPVRACEAATQAPSQVLLDGKDLPVPRTDIRRIVVFGDTGCRIKKEKVQDCNDPKKWPYKTLAKHAATKNPDVVVHVGDYLYREKPCAPNVKRCPDSPTGYGWTVWNDDFFTPSQPLFAAAPWIMVRGNHEICSRAGEGWFRFLDHAPMSPNCLAMSDFFVVTAGTFGFVVLDSGVIANAGSADADEETEDDDDVAGSGQVAALAAALRHNYSAVAPAIPSNAWLVSHVSFDAVRLVNHQTEVDNTLQQQTLGSLLPASVQAIVSGHVHMFEALGFGKDIPPQLVVGTGGTKLAKAPDPLKEINGIPVASSLILKDFGYMLWERDEHDAVKWSGTLFGQDGSPVGLCRLEGRKLTCKQAR